MQKSPNAIISEILSQNPVNKIQRHIICDLYKSAKQKLRKLSKIPAPFRRHIGSWGSTSLSVPPPYPFSAWASVGGGFAVEAVLEVAGEVSAST